MEKFLELFDNLPLIAAVIAWAIAQLLKIIIDIIVDRKFTWEKLFASGGMPSSHSAFVTALTTVIGMKFGFESEFFSISAAFALVVMYDACGVRRAVGEQAKVINRILESFKENSALGSEKAMKEILGHSPFQVVMGFLLGLTVGIILGP